MGTADKRIVREQVTDECPPGLSIDNDDHVRREHAQENGATRH